MTSLDGPLGPVFLPSPGELAARPVQIHINDLQKRSNFSLELFFRRKARVGVTNVAVTVD
jgi:hypothetical protein